MQNFYIFSFTTFLTLQTFNRIVLIFMLKRFADLVTFQFRKQEYLREI